MTILNLTKNTHAWQASKFDQLIMVWARYYKLFKRRALVIKLQFRFLNIKETRNAV